MLVWLTSTVPAPCLTRQSPQEVEAYAKMINVDPQTDKSPTTVEIVCPTLMECVEGVLSFPSSSVPCVSLICPICIVGDLIPLTASSFNICLHSLVSPHPFHSLMHGMCIQNTDKVYLLLGGAVTKNKHG